MAENKKGFVLYADLIHTVEKLSSEKAGDLFKHILRYVNDHDPVTEDMIIDLCFEPIKQQLKRDLKHWQNVVSKRSEAGKIGGLKSGETRRKQTEANEAIDSNVKQTKQDESNEAVIVNDNVIVNVNDNVINTNTAQVLVVKEKVIESEFERTFSEYLEMRKKIRKPATGKAIQLVREKLKRFGTEEVQIKHLEQSILNGWQDVYPLKNDTKLNQTEVMMKQAMETKRWIKETYGE